MTRRLPKVHKRRVCDGILIGGVVMWMKDRQGA